MLVNGTRIFQEEKIRDIIQQLIAQKGRDQNTWFRLLTFSGDPNDLKLTEDLGTADATTSVDQFFNQPAAPKNPQQAQYAYNFLDKIRLNNTERSVRGLKD